MRIRLANRDDLPVLEKLVGYFFAEQAAKFDLPRLEEGAMALIRHGIETKQAVFVAEQEGAIIGWVARVMAPGLPEGMAVGVGRWVFEPYRREQVNFDLCREADDYAAALGAKYLTGEVALNNEAGQKAVLKDGWEIVGYAIRKKLQSSNKEAAA